MESRVPGLSFAAQPAALTIAVSFTEGVKPHLTVLHHDYNDATPLLLVAEDVMESTAKTTGQWIEKETRRK